MEKVEFGYALSKEDWQQSARNILEAGTAIAELLKRLDADGRGQEDADEFITDILLAYTAMNYVAVFAADKCRIMPVPNGGQNELR